MTSPRRAARIASMVSAFGVSGSKGNAALLEFEDRAAIQQAPKVSF